MELINEFLQIRQDVLTRTLGGGAPGKFVETFVQALQHLHTGSYEKAPAVDSFLRTIESQASSVPDDLRIIGARLARAMYALRSKRNVVHKGSIDPNTYDLQFLHHGAQWITAELLRQSVGSSMQDAGRLVDAVQAPVGGVVEDFGGRTIVNRVLPSREEALILLHSKYPDPVALATLTQSMDRYKPVTVRGTVRKLWQEKLVDGNAQAYRLTKQGHAAAIALLLRYT